MSDNLMLDHLRAIRAELRELRIEQKEQRARIAAIEWTLVDLLRSFAAIKGEEVGLRAEFSGRFDRVLDRLDTIDRRLDAMPPE